MRRMSANMNHTIVVKKDHIVGVCIYVCLMFPVKFHSDHFPCSLPDLSIMISKFGTTARTDNCSAQLKNNFYIHILSFHCCARPSLSEVGIKNRKIFIGDTCFYLRQQISSSAESIDFILISVVHARVREAWNLTIVNSFSFFCVATIHWSARSYWRGFCSGFNARSAHAIYFKREKKREKKITR